MNWINIKLTYNKVSNKKPISKYNNIGDENDKY